jgi:hypothetical protein
MSTSLDVDDDPAWDVEPNPDIVHWQPTHAPDGGALAIGRLAIGRASFRRVEIDELVVGRIRFKD